MKPDKPVDDIYSYKPINNLCVIDKNVNMTDIETSAEFSDHYTSAEDDFQLLTCVIACGLASNISPRHFLSPTTNFLLSHEHWQI